MARPDIKVLVAEVSGTELNESTERRLSAEDCDFVDAGFSAENAKDAIIEAKSQGTTALEQPRFSFVLVHNGSLSNGQAIRWGNLTNSSPLVIPKKCVLKEVTFACDNTNADANFKFYKGTVSAPNLFFDWTFSNSKTKLAVDPTDFTSPTFNPGDLIEITFTDTGDNPSDMVMVLFFQAVP